MSESIAPFLDFSHFLFAALGALLTLSITHFLSKDRERSIRRETEIRAEKLQFLPVIETTTQELGKDQPLLVWRKRKPELGTIAARFRLLLSGRQRNRFDEAWRGLENTKDEEILYNGKDWFVPGQESEIVAAREIITKRLTRVHEIASKV